jgi:uncharacterized protein YbjT (DUF2867 family)
VTGLGATTEVLSRSTGFDVLEPGAAARLEGYDVIVEATGHFTTRERVAVDFFTRSTRTVATAARAGGAKHILLSIVNCELPEVHGYGYFAGKAAQEECARAGSEWLTVVRSTQWFEFARQNRDRMTVGPIALVPTMTIRPVALRVVASVIAECALGIRGGDFYEVAGPEVTTLWEMTKRLPDKQAVPVPLTIPTRTGRAFKDGVLVPGSGVETRGPSFAQWLAEPALQG